MNKSTDQLVKLIKESWLKLYEETNKKHVVFTMEEDVRCHFFKILLEEAKEKYLILNEQFYDKKTRIRADIVVIDIIKESLALIELKFPKYDSKGQLLGKINEDIEKLRTYHNKFPEARVGFSLTVDRYSKLGDENKSPEFKLEEQGFPIYSSIFVCCSPNWCPNCKVRKDKGCDFLISNGYTNAPWYFNSKSHT